MNKFTPRSLSETLLLLLKARNPELFRENGTLNEARAGRMFGVDQPTFRRWAKGGTPKSEYVELLAKKLSVTPAQMRGESPINAIDGYSYQTAEDEALLREIAALPDELKAMIREQIAVYKKLNDRNQ